MKECCKDGVWFVVCCSWFVVRGLSIDYRANNHHPVTDKKPQMLQLIKKNCIYLCGLHTCEGLSDSRGAFRGF